MSSPPTEPSPMDAAESDRQLATFTVRFGWIALLVFALLGLALEGLHGFKVGWYLEHETRRLMWTLAHAHGVLLSLVIIVYGALLWLWPATDQPWRRTASACLLAASVLLPTGFFLGGAFIYGGDPGLGILLAPMGAVAFLAGVALAARNLRPS